MLAAGVESDAALDDSSLLLLTFKLRDTLLRRTITALLASRNAGRAQTHRRQEGIADEEGTAVDIVEMVFGNTGPDSGSGVCLTRHPATGEPGLFVSGL